MTESIWPTRERMIEMLTSVGGIRERLETADDETIEMMWLDVFVKLKV